ncbi:MAG: hypothetical protein WBL21_08235, partial [Salinimicrobium sp.]
VYMGLSFALIVVLTFTLFATQNDNSINSIKDLSSFLKEQKGEDIDRVVVFDYLLPSAAFYFDKPIVTIHDQNFLTRRETEFETDSTYKRNYINLPNEGEVKRFKDLLKQKNTLLILKKKKEFPDSLQYLLKAFPQTAEKGKWRVYY